MTGDDFLKLAEKFCADPRQHNEALCRTIVSRAYYGAFHLARDFVVRLGFPQPSERKVLSDWLVSSGEPSVIRAGDILSDLATARNRADYDLAIPKVVKQVQDVQYLRQTLEQALSVKDLLRQAAAEQSQIVARQGIAKYWASQ